MKANRGYPQVIITAKGERALAGGHPWVYEGEVVEVTGAGGAADAREAAGAAGSAPGERRAALENGCLVDVLSRKGRYLGTGLYSAQSKIRVRIISRNANDCFNEAFWERKVRWAWEHRRAVMGGSSGVGSSMGAGAGEDLTCCRLIFSEADGFPGLIADRFNDVVVTQTLSIGMERCKPAIFAALTRVLTEDGVELRGIYERNDVSTRRLEGLDETCGWHVNDAPAPLPADNPAAASFGPTMTEICENGVRYHVDFARGQKTGFFLDQKYNRRAVARLAHGRRVLDCFTHTGSFALNAALGGAEHVHAVDISELAVDMARENAELNGLADRMSFEAVNVFDLLPELEREGGHRGRVSETMAAHGGPFDFIILDPPAFTKSRRTIDAAERGYHEINQRAMKILPRGGYLATCSCSHFMDTGRFRRMLASAAHDANVQLRQIEERQQAPDHPIVWGIPETDYLKFFLFQVV